MLASTFLFCAMLESYGSFTWKLENFTFVAGQKRKNDDANGEEAKKWLNTVS
jgi:hypothetical protein